MTTVYGDTPDISGTEDDLTIRPSNGADFGIAPARHADTTVAETGDSAFDQLLGLAKVEISNVKKFPVRSRPGGFVLEFDAVVTEPDIKRYRNASKGKKKNVEDADMSIGNAMVMIEKNTGIYQDVDGQLKKIQTRDGEDLLLGSDEFLTAFGRGALAHVAVRKFLGDAETNTIGAAVLKAAGWGEDLEPLDPTEA
jgi:hypothetical protein